jgi:Txe/YoeB family toxin of Txe-Axe toxin-antitoxin module
LKLAIFLVAVAYGSKLMTFGAIFSTKVLDDLKYWKKSGKIQIQEKISLLIASFQLTPFAGIDKPKP